MLCILTTSKGLRLFFIKSLKKLTVVTTEGITRRQEGGGRVVAATEPCRK